MGKYSLMEKINKEECKRILAYLYFDHIRRNEDQDGSWGFSICLLEFAYYLMADFGHGCEIVGCDCEICVARNEMTKHGKEFAEAYE